LIKSSRSVALKCGTSAVGRLGACVKHVRKQQMRRRLHLRSCNRQVSHDILISTCYVSHLIYTSILSGVHLNSASSQLPVDLRAGATLGLGNGLRLRTSTVPASGLGVFVTRAVKAGARITEVSGTVISDFGVRSLSKVQREGVAALFVGWPALEKRLYILGDRGPQFLPCSPLGSMVNDAGHHPSHAWSGSSWSRNQSASMDS